MLASSRVEMHSAQPGSNASSIRKATVAKVHGSPRRSRISRNPSRRESRMIRFTCGLLVRFCAHDRGCNRRPAFPAPSFLEEGETDANLGRIAPRECGRMFACLELNAQPLSSFSPCGRRWREAPDEGSPSADDDQPLTRPRRCASRHPSESLVSAPTRGEGKAITRNRYLTSANRSDAGSAGCPPAASCSRAVCWRGPRRVAGLRARLPRPPSGGRYRAASADESHHRRGWRR